MATKKSPETVRVVVRCRPMSRKEVEDSRVKIVQINDKSGEVSPRSPSQETRSTESPPLTRQAINAFPFYRFQFPRRPLRTRCGLAAVQIAECAIRDPGPGCAQEPGSGRSRGAQALHVRPGINPSPQTPAIFAAAAVWSTSNEEATFLQDSFRRRWARWGRTWGPAGSGEAEGSQDAEGTDP